MTAPDLAAVCRAHGIDLRELDVLGTGDTVTLAVCQTTPETRMGTTPADAVCALLKARWGMTTDRNDWRRWYAWTDMHCTEQDHTTELAAVLALADRLKDGAS